MAPPSKPAPSKPAPSPSKPSSTSTTFVGAIDQGTTSSRFLIFNRNGEVVALHQIEFKQLYPQPG